MTRLSLLLVPAAALIGALMGNQFSGAMGFILALTVGGVLAAVLWSRQVAVVRHLASHVNRWLRERNVTPVSLGGSHHWHELQVAVNAVGAAYQRRGDKLRLERPWRRDLVDAIVGPALLFGSDSRLIVANDDARQLLGVHDQDERPTLLQAVGSTALASAAREAQASGRRVELDAPLRDREVQAVASVVGDEVLMVITDRTHQRQIEAMRRAFVINASHELKTPATAIQSLSDALAVVADRDPDKVRSLGERLRSEADRLVRIVGDLLDLRRLEERGELEHVAVDIAAIARQVASELAPMAADEGIEVDLDAPATARVAAVAGDIRLIIENLVRNAVQYSESGTEVAVTIRPDNGSYTLTVADQGIGIPQHDLPHIFERFYRVDEDRSRQTGGTGLGLAIVRHAVERMGGTVSVDSLLGEGTTFTVRLPIDQPAA